MTDGSNIDDILKSIDALLKEGHEEPQRNDDIHDDAIGDVADAEIPLTTASNATANQAEISILPDVVDDEFGGEVDRAESETRTDSPAAESPVEEQQPNEQYEQSKPEQNEPVGQQDAGISGKRILLSADMQVQDTPELPLNAAVEMAQEEACETAIEDTPSLTVDEAQVTRITAEICAELQRQLPEMITPLVAAALRRHLASDGSLEPRK